MDKIRKRTPVEMVDMLIYICIYVGICLPYQLVGQFVHLGANNLPVQGFVM